MIEIYLAIDEKRMALPLESPANIAERLILLSDLLETARSDNHCTRWLRSSLYQTTIINGITFSDLLFNRNNIPIDRDTQRLLQEQLGRCKDLDDVPNAENTTKEQVAVWRKRGQAAAIWFWMTKLSLIRPQ